MTYSDKGKKSDLLALRDCSFYASFADKFLTNRNGSSVDWGDGSKSDEQVVHLGDDYSCLINPK